jgi:hypothetical protein
MKTFVLHSSVGLAISISLLSCGSNSSTTPGVDAAPVSASCAKATQHSDLTWIQDNVFSPSCSKFGACHKDAATSAAGLNLESGKSRSAMVGIKSTLFPQFDLVAAGNARDSYLMTIIGHYPGSLKPGVGTMPINSAVLCVEKREAIDRWIAAGAMP